MNSLQKFLANDPVIRNSKSSFTTKLEKIDKIEDLPSWEELKEHGTWHDLMICIGFLYETLKIKAKN